MIHCEMVGRDVRVHGRFGDRHGFYDFTYAALQNRLDQTMRSQVNYVAQYGDTDEWMAEVMMLRGAMAFLQENLTVAQAMGGGEMNKNRTLTEDDLAIIGMQDEIKMFDYDDRHVHIAINFILDYMRRVVAENRDLRGRVGEVEDELRDMQDKGGEM